MRDSVLTAGLLPNLGRKTNAPSVPQVCVAPSCCGFASATNRWTHINTDHMAVSQVRSTADRARNLPRLDGLPADVGEYVEPLIEGFSAMYRFLMARRY